MSTDWLPIDTNLEQKLPIVLLSQMLGDSEDDTSLALGRIVRFWLWASRQTANGLIRGASVATLIRLFGADDEFWLALAAHGWLEIRDDGLRIPKFREHFSQVAKRRKKDARRKQKARESRAPTPPQDVDKKEDAPKKPVRKMSAKKRTKSGLHQSTERSEYRRRHYGQCSVKEDVVMAEGPRQVGAVLAERSDLKNPSSPDPPAPRIAMRSESEHLAFRWARRMRWPKHEDTHYLEHVARLVVRGVVPEMAAADACEAVLAGVRKTYGGKFRACLRDWFERHGIPPPAEILPRRKMAM